MNKITVDVVGKDFPKMARYEAVGFSLEDCGETLRIGRETGVGVYAHRDIDLSNNSVQITIDRRRASRCR